MGAAGKQMRPLEVVHAARSIRARDHARRARRCRREPDATAAREQHGVIADPATGKRRIGDTTRRATSDRYGHLRLGGLKQNVLAVSGEDRTWTHVRDWKLSAANELSDWIVHPPEVESHRRA